MTFLLDDPWQQEFRWTILSWFMRFHEDGISHHGIYELIGTAAIRLHSSICSLHVPHDKENVCDRFQPVISVWQSTDESENKLATEQCEHMYRNPGAWACRWLIFILASAFSSCQIFPLMTFFKKILDDPWQQEIRWTILSWLMRFLRMVSTITECSLNGTAACTVFVFAVMDTMCHMMKKYVCDRFSQCACNDLTQLIQWLEQWADQQLWAVSKMFFGFAEYLKQTWGMATATTHFWHCSNFVLPVSNMFAVMLWFIYIYIPVYK